MIIKVCYNDREDSDVDSYIDSLYCKSLDMGARARRKYDLLKESLPEVTEEIRERFIQNYKHDFILENLQSHDIDKLKKALAREYGEKIRGVDSFDATGKTIARIVFDSESDAKDVAEGDENFKNILEFFNYFVTQINGNHVFVEPRYSERADSYVYGVCHGVVCHVTSREAADEILKSGLRCRNGSKEKDPDGVPYRKFPKRIYVCAMDPKTVNRRMRDEILGELARKVSDADDMVALRIQVGGIPFYKDTAMPDRMSYFTYNNIPPQCIEKVIELS